jgi:antitoxin CptB
MSDFEPVPEPVLDPRRRRLVFRAHHRGTKEADLMIGGFVARSVAAMSEAELAALEAVLELPDVDLTDWLTGRVPVPPEHLTPLMQRMLVECSASGAGLPEDVRRA